jgi:hypothetical protein
MSMTPIDSLAGSKVANSAALTIPMPPIAVLEKPVRKPMSANNKIRVSDILSY